MSAEQLSLLLCLIKTVISPDTEWSKDECKIRANEFVQAAEQTQEDPLLLVAISVYECDLRDNKDTLYYDPEDVKKVVARDVCPMGFRIKHNIHKLRGGMTRVQVIDKAAKLLKSYKDYHFAHKHRGHGYLREYNAGFQNIENGYSNNVREIYTALKSGKSTFKLVNGRTQELAYGIRRSLGYLHEDPFKDCKPRSSCALASTKPKLRRTRHHSDQKKAPQLSQAVLRGVSG